MVAQIETVPELQILPDYWLFDDLERFLSCGLVKMTGFYQGSA